MNRSRLTAMLAVIVLSVCLIGVVHETSSAEATDYNDGMPISTFVVGQTYENAVVAYGTEVSGELPGLNFSSETINGKSAIVANGTPTDVYETALNVSAGGAHTFVQIGSISSDITYDAGVSEVENATITLYQGEMYDGVVLMPAEALIEADVPGLNFEMVDGYLCCAGIPDTPGSYVVDLYGSKDLTVNIIPAYGDAANPDSSYSTTALLVYTAYYGNSVYIQKGGSVSITKSVNGRTGVTYQVVSISPGSGLTLSDGALSGSINEGTFTVTVSYSESSETRTLTLKGVTEGSGGGGSSSYNVYFYTYSGNGYTLKSSTTTTGSVSFPSVSNPSGYVYKGWRSTNSSSGVPSSISTSISQYTSSTTVSEDTYFFAVYSKAYNIYYYQWNGSSYVQTSTSTTTGQVYVPTGTDPAGYVYKGWRTADSASGIPSSISTVTASVTYMTTVYADTWFYATYNAETTSYSVSFYTSGGSSYSVHSTVSTSSSVTFPTPTAPSGYRLSGWKVAPTSSYIPSTISTDFPTYTVSSTTVTHDTIFYAVYERLYNVKYFEWDGSSYSQSTSSTVPGGYMNLKSSAGAVSGYIFGGWKAASSAQSYSGIQVGNGVKGSYNLTGDTWFYATYLHETITVTYHANNGTNAELNDTVQNDGTGLVVLADSETLNGQFQKTNCTITGLSRNANLASEYELGQSINVIDDHLVLYCVWTEEGGTPVDPDTYYINMCVGDTFNYVPKCNVNGATFEWFRTTSNSEESYAVANYNAVNGTMNLPNDSSSALLMFKPTKAGTTVVKLTASHSASDQIISQTIYFNVVGKMDISGVFMSGDSLTNVSITKNGSIATVNTTIPTSMDEGCFVFTLDKGSNPLFDLENSTIEYKAAGADSYMPDSTETFNVYTGTASNQVMIGLTKAPAVGTYLIVIPATWTSSGTNQTSASESMSLVVTITVMDGVGIMANQTASVVVGKTSTTTIDLVNDEFINTINFEVTDSGHSISSKLTETMTSTPRSGKATLTVDATQLSNVDLADECSATVTLNVGISGTQTVNGQQDEFSSAGTINLTVYRALEFTTAPTINEESTVVYASSDNSMKANLSTEITGATKVTYDWGDGYTSTDTTFTGVTSNYTASHTYAKSGTYFVKIIAENDFGTTTYVTPFSTTGSNISLEVPLTDNGELPGYMLVIIMVILIGCLIVIGRLL